MVEDERLIADDRQGRLGDMDVEAIDPASGRPIDAALPNVCLGERRRFPVAEYQRERTIYSFAIAE